MKVGVVGTGMIAQTLVPHFEEWGLPVTGVCGTPRSWERVRELAERVGARPYESLAAMLAAPDVEAVYIATPNHVHHAQGMEVLAAGKHVIMEKPFAATYEEAAELAAAARERDLLIYEAVTTIHQPNYARIRELLGRIGDIKLVSLNYSQYSSRYDAFCAGEVLPAFDPAKAGGALMDLGLYNLQWIVGLFGAPVSATYLPNVERGIDTSGVATLDYGSFKAASVAAKDCAAPTINIIQGTRGYILQDTPAGTCGAVTLHLNNGTEEVYDENPENRWESVFCDIAAGLNAADREGCYRLLDHSLTVSRVMTEARCAAGIRFPADMIEK